MKIWTAVFVANNAQVPFILRKVGPAVPYASARLQTAQAAHTMYRLVRQCYIRGALYGMPLWALDKKEDQVVII